MIHEIIQNISHRVRQNNLLEQITSKLLKDFDLIPIVGAEIEFYTKDQTPPEVEYLVKSEKGNGQFEIDIFPQANIFKTIEEIWRAKQILASSENIILHPKPKIEDYGSAMHFHINFFNSKGENFFDNQQNLEHAAKSLCHFILQHFLIFVPHESHYPRFNKDFMAPTHVCFGGNNRSVAIRIPDAKPRRLEHRISSPMTDEYLAICAILEAIYCGLKDVNSIKNYDKIFGNAYDSQYELISLPTSIEEAIKLFKFA